MLEVFFGQRKQTDEHSKGQQKPTDSNQTQSKRTGRMLCQQNTPKMIGELMIEVVLHTFNLKCLLCCHYVEHIDKLKGFKSEWIKGSTNFC